MSSRARVRHWYKTGSKPRLATAPCASWPNACSRFSSGGLQRRARLNADGKDERIHLEPLSKLVQSGKTPADVMIEGLTPASTPSVAEIIARAHI